MLMALELPLPARVYAHAFWIRDGMKMSKSLGNFVDLAAMQRYIDAYGLDAFRYYLVLDGPLGATGAPPPRFARRDARCAPCGGLLARMKR
jgi:methionyl-tRNA synthetase